MVITNDVYCVYIHTNKSNGKVYVGQTRQEPTKRWKNGLGYDRCPYFFKAIQKYGWDGFEHEIIASHLTKTEADNFEKLLINKLNSANPVFGYNLSEGGSGTSGCMSEETKRKISKTLSKRVQCVETGEIYNSVTEAQKITKISHISLACLGKRKSAGGYHWRYCDA